MYEETAKKEFGVWLQQERESKDIKRSTLASALGYKNTNKGCRRILKLEQGEMEPTEEQKDVLLSTLRISTVEWAEKRAVVDQAKKRARRYSTASSTIVQQTEEFLAHESTLLLQQHKLIQATSHWKHIHLPGQRFYMMYMGGGASVQLGPLLDIWSTGGLQTQRPEGDFFVTSGQCSPLSGRHTVDGFFRETGHRKRLKNLDRGIATSLIGKALTPLRQGAMGTSAWSLPQLLAQLKRPIQPAEIFWQDDLHGQYDFHTATLQWKGEEISFPLLTKHAHSTTYADYSVEEKWSTPTRQGRIVLGDILTGQFGSYLGEQHTVQTTSGHWTLHPGFAQDPAGFPQIRWTADLPPLVQVWLIQNITSIQDC